MSNKGGSSVLDTFTREFQPGSYFCLINVFDSIDFISI